jgi:GNAT superfamily N-acetyltransferase
VARQALWSYLDEVVSRYYGRPATKTEIDAAMCADPSDDLAFPYGLLLLARQDGVVLGCAGLRFLPDGVGEVKRVFVTPSARGRGLGAQLMGELERLAREHNLSMLRLDTRRDLIEARRLYARLGYNEVAAFNDGPYADYWFAKSLV